MAKEVETRVVEMEFKNKDFEKAIDVTLESIDELNKKLDSLNNVNTSGFDQLTKAANNVDFSGISNSIDYIASRFSVLGMAAQNIKGVIVNEMMDAAASITGAFNDVIGTIQEKGNARALNLEQAKFQLSNLGVSWNKIKSDIDYAVDDTRFGLDEAAMAASQLVASGVKIGNNMKHALLGISGVAAMTNAEYSEIAHIFTTIAGTGKLYRQQLNMIAGRGLNATAAIAKYLGITEAEVNEILGKKDDFIDFATFAEAMFSEYGESAKKGNDLFTGALANAKAALGRIGEKFYTPFHEYARQVLVEVKPVINSINKALDPMFKGMDHAMHGIRNTLVEALQMFEEDFTIFGKKVNLKEEVSQFAAWIQNVFIGIGEGFSEGLNSDMAKALFNILGNLYGLLSTIKQAIQDTFGTPTVSTFLRMADSIKDFTEYLKLSETGLNNLKRTLGGVLAIIDMALKTGKALFEVFIEPLLDILKDVIAEVFGFTGDLGDALSELNKHFNIAAPLKNIMIDIMLEANPIIKEIKETLLGVVEALKKLTGIRTVNDLVEELKKLGGSLHLKEAFELVGGAILYALDCLIKFKDSLVSVFDSSKGYIDNVAATSRVLTWLKNTLESIKTTITDVTSGNKSLSEALGLDKLKEKFSWITDIIDKFKEHYKSIWEARRTGDEAVEGLPFLEQFGDGLKDAIKNLKFEDIFGAIGAGFWAYFLKKAADLKVKIAEVITPLGEIFQNVVNQTSKEIEESTAAKFLKIAGGIALLAASVMMLGKMDYSQVRQGVDAIAELLTYIGLFVVIIGKLLQATKTTEKSEGELEKLQTIKNKGILQTSIDKIAEQFNGIKETVQEKVSQLSEVPGIILALGASIFLIVSSIAKLAKAAGENPETFKDVASLIKVVMLEFGVIAGALVMFAKQKDGSSSLNEEAVAAIAKVVLCIGIAIRLIVGAIATLALFPADKFGAVLAASGIIAVLMVALTAMVWGLTKFAKECTLQQVAGIVAASASMILIALAVQMLTIPIVAIAAVTKLAGLGAIVTASVVVVAMLAALGGVVVGFAFLSKVSGSVATMLAGAASMVLIAGALTLLTIPLVALTALAKWDVDALWQAVGVIAILTIVMGAIIGLFALVSGDTAGMGAVGMLAGAASMILLSIALAALLIPLAGLIALEKTGSLDKAFEGLGKGLLILAAAAAVATVFCVGLAAIAATVLAFGLSVYLVGEGAQAAAIALALFIASLYAISNMDFAKLAENIALFGVSVILGICQAINTGIPQIIEAMKLLVGAVAKALLANLGMLTETAIKLLEDIIIAIDNHAPQLGYHLGSALMKVIEYAIAGVVGGAGDIIGDIFFGNRDKKFSEKLKERFFGKKEDIKAAADETAKESTDELKRSVNENSVGTGDAAVNVMSTEVASESNTKKMSFAFSSLFDGAGNDWLSSNSLGDIGEEAGYQTTEGVTANMNPSTAADISNNFGGSLEDTLRSWTKPMYNAGFDVTSAAVDGGYAGTDSHSPSKEAIKIGEFFNEGLIIGLKDNEGVYNTAKKSARGIVSTFGIIENSAKSIFSGNAINSFSEAIAKIGQSELLNHDFTPTISPVLDLSNITSGFNTIDGMFNSKRSIALAGEAAYMQEANRTLNLNIQNDKSKNLNDGMSSLGGKIDRLGEALLSRQIVLDSGEVVGGLVDPMDRALGVRVIRAQRGGRR